MDFQYDMEKHLGGNIFVGAKAGISVFLIFVLLAIFRKQGATVFLLAKDKMPIDIYTVKSGLTDYMLTWIHPPPED